MGGEGWGGFDPPWHSKEGTGGQFALISLVSSHKLWEEEACVVRSRISALGSERGVCIDVGGKTTHVMVVGTIEGGEIDNFMPNYPTTIPYAQPPQIIQVIIRPCCNS